VCISLPPYEPPTGRFLGIVHFQRMLRYPPHERMGTLLDTTTEPVRADTSAAEVSRILASYNLVQVPVVDANHRLVGVVTVDDVLDRLLPDDWRSSDADDGPRVPPRRPSTDTGAILTRPRRAARGRAR
jgi:Mg/Co/Ni transporter MgtE